MKHIYLITLLFCNIALYGQVDVYLDEYRASGKSDFEKEKELLGEATQLPELLRPYLQDSLLHVRQKAYSFLYRKGRLVAESEKHPYIILLLKGCEDPNGSIVGQNLIWLQSFSKNDFPAEAKELINALLRNSQVPHRKRLIMLAGYVNAGKEWMKRQSLQPDLSPNDRWFLNLALARLGDEAGIEFCLGALQPLELNNNLVEFGLPDIIYTRQKKLLNICIDYLNSDEPACLSADPDNETPLLCGYRILEMIAPVIIDFPVKVSAIGGLETTDYRQALLTARQWFREHPDYQVQTDEF